MTQPLDRRTEVDGAVDALLAHHSNVAGDIIEITEHAWAIHGAIAVDGDVILAEFTTAEEARAVLARLASLEHAAAAPNRARS